MQTIAPVAVAVAVIFALVTVVGRIVNHRRARAAALRLAVRRAAREAGATPQVWRAVQAALEGQPGSPSQSTVVARADGRGALRQAVSDGGA